MYADGEAASLDCGRAQGFCRASCAALCSIGGLIVLFRCFLGELLLANRTEQAATCICGLASLMWDGNHHPSAGKRLTCNFHACVSGVKMS